ncbi:MAG: hypothetical protein LBC53_07570 [Spirochaetaceae bacterium]|jgi:hypothetical protein|nr:hypothetical protein [Spirochaetaceae bacterium]
MKLLETGSIKECTPPPVNSKQKYYILFLLARFSSPAFLGCAQYKQRRKGVP